VSDWIALGQRHDHTIPAGIGRKDRYLGPTLDHRKTLTNGTQSTKAEQPSEINKITFNSGKGTKNITKPPVCKNDPEAWTAKELRPARTWRSSRAKSTVQRSFLASVHTLGSEATFTKMASQAIQDPGRPVIVPPTLTKLTTPTSGSAPTYDYIRALDQTAEAGQVLQGKGSFKIISLPRQE
jgi:hypothetical protein